METVGRCAPGRGATTDALPPPRGHGDVLVRMPLTYAAFCGDRWEVYSRFAAASVGAAQLGAELARAALGDLALVWVGALQSRSPAALAWDLLGARTRAQRTKGARRLYGLLPRHEADALLLSYKLGLSPQRAADAMGLATHDVCVLRRQALRKLTSALTAQDRHVRPAVGGRTAAGSAPVAMQERRRRLICAPEVSPVGGGG
jgi:hypothetical protein